MKIRTISLALGLMAIAGAGAASAVQTQQTQQPQQYCFNIPFYGQLCLGGQGGTTQAPEIDPSSAMAGLTLLAGGLAVLRGRRFKKSS